MSNYKIGLLIFSNAKPQATAVFQSFEKLIKKESFGVIKSVEILEQNSALVSSVVDAYKNTNLGMIVLVAPDADKFFTFSELEEVGQKNEKYLVTLNLDEKSENHFLQIIQKVKDSPGKARRGCDSSCR